MLVVEVGTEDKLSASFFVESVLSTTEKTEVLTGQTSDEIGDQESTPDTPAVLRTLLAAPAKRGKVRF